MDQWFPPKLESTVISNMQIPPWALCRPQWNGRHPKHHLHSFEGGPGGCPPKGFCRLWTEGRWRGEESPDKVGGCSWELSLQKSCPCLSGDSKGRPGWHMTSLPHPTVGLGEGWGHCQDLVSKWDCYACHLKEEVGLGERNEHWTRSLEVWSQLCTASLEALSQAPHLLGTQFWISTRSGLDTGLLRAPSIHLFIHYKHFLFLLCARHVLSTRDRNPNKTCSHHQELSVCQEQRLYDQFILRMYNKHPVHM